MRINKLEITSATNPRIKAIKKLEQKRERDREGLFVIEGFHLVEEAIKHHAEIETILYSASADVALLAKIETDLMKNQGHQQNLDSRNTGIDFILITDSILKTLANTPAPQGIIAILKQPKMAIEMLLDDNKRPLAHLLLLDNVQDPGNVGTMIRTAEAAGFKGIILGDGSADLFNDKTIRATQGALFQLLKPI